MDELSGSQVKSSSAYRVVLEFGAAPLSVDEFPRHGERETADALDDEQVELSHCVELGYN